MRNTGQEREARLTVCSGGSPVATRDAGPQGSATSGRWPSNSDQLRRPLPHSKRCRFADLDATEPRTSRAPVDADLLDRLAFPLSLALPGYRSCTWSGDDGRPDAVGIWTPDGSVARVHLDGKVRQAGPGAVWDEVEVLAGLFPAGPPAREDFGLTVTPGAQHAWYGAPDGPSWPCPVSQ